MDCRRKWNPAKQYYTHKDRRLHSSWNDRSEPIKKIIWLYLTIPDNGVVTFFQKQDVHRKFLCYFNLVIPSKVRVFLLFFMIEKMTMVDQSNLFIGNFSWNLGEQDLRELFEPYGELEDVKLIIDRMTGRSKGIGFVKFVNVEDAAAAVSALNNQEVDGRSIIVSVARPREERPQGRERSY